MSEKKPSNFENKVLEILNETEDKPKKAKKAYERAVAKINIQLTQLEAKKLEIEDEIDQANDDVEAAKFKQHFDLYKFDQTVSHVEELQEQLEAINKTIENRKQLLKDWE